MNQWDKLFLIDYEVEFFVHNNKLLIGKRYDGFADRARKFIEDFTWYEDTVPNDILCFERKPNQLLINSANNRRTIRPGDYIFRSHNYHFFSKKKKDVEFGTKYIPVPFELASKMVEQNDFSSNLGDDFTKKDYYIIPYDGKTDVDSILMNAAIVNHNIMEFQKSFVPVDESKEEKIFDIYYSSYRFYETDYKDGKVGFLVRYNFINDTNSWDTYCDVSDIQVTPVFENNVIVWDTKNKKVFVVRDINTANRYIKRYFN